MWTPTCWLGRLEELREALVKGKRKKSVGIDGVPHEPLVAIGESDEGAGLLLEWFNRLLPSRSLPESWERVITVLIPKVAQPSLAKHVRPICFAGAIKKVYCRMLLHRTRQALRFSGPAQTMRRQTTSLGGEPNDGV